MKIRQISIRNFRGIRLLEWTIASPLSCIVGPGDSGKSTIIDALEVALGNKWATFADVDFFEGDTSQPIEITVTVGELPTEALRDNRMGLYLRGWKTEGVLRDEPEDDDESVVTIRLSVDSSLDPVWELITVRQPPRPLSLRDRTLFGVVRLGGDSERHLTWGQGSALARLSDNKEQAAPLLADAYRKARDLLKAGTLPELDAVAARVREEAIRLGAYAGKEFSAGLDTQRSSMSLGSLAMHGDGIPLRLSGLGTRRLVALAVQQMAIPDGAIVLIDEVEHGLEPHRLRHALKILREGLTKSPGVGQVILTTHSSTSVVELSCDQLAVCRKYQDGVVVLNSPEPNLQALVRRVPEAFLSRAILVCEGKTEVGLIRGLRDFWAKRNGEEPLESLGVMAADGGGTEAVATSCGLAKLGYDVALLRDSDVLLTSEESRQLSELNIKVFQWGDALATEERIILDASTEVLPRLLDLAIEYFNEESVLDSIRGALGTQGRISRDVASWNVDGMTEIEIRKGFGNAAKKKGWFKDIERGERVGLILATELATGAISPTATTLAVTESWIYGR